MGMRMLYRAGMAIVLTATLLLPYGTCQPPSRLAAHNCCGHPAAPAATVKANCCTVHSQLPAFVVDRAAVGPDQLIASSYVAAAAPSVGFFPRPAVFLAQHSPPPGKSVLRI